jgi:Photoprotection regulator fluorescence recovery protein
MTESWSPAEKKIARRAFDKALDRETAELQATFKQRAATVTSIDQVWEIEIWLKQRRLEIDQKYDYRYARLILVFARLRHQGFVDAADLAGLSEDKLAAIELCFSSQ